MKSKMVKGNLSTKLTSKNFIHHLTTHIDPEEIINSQNEMIRVLSYQLKEDPSATEATASMIEIYSQIISIFLDVKRLQDEGI